MTYKSSRQLRTALMASLLTTVAINAWAVDPPIEFSSNMSPWQDDIEGGAFDFKMSSGTSTLYSFGLHPRAGQNSGYLSVEAYDGFGPEYMAQTVQNFVPKGAAFVSKKDTKFGAKVLMYIHSGNVYFIMPEAPLHQSADYTKPLVKTKYSKKLPLSLFTGLDTASKVHMNKKSLLWLNGTSLYTGGPAYDTGAGGSTLISSNITSAKSFGPFLFVQDNTNKIFFVGGPAQNNLILIPGETTFNFLSDKSKAYMMESDTIQLAALTNTENYKFKYTDTFISNQAVVLPVQDDATSITTAMTIKVNAAYANGYNTYIGANTKGGYVLTRQGNLVSTNSAYGTPLGSVPLLHEYTCIDTPDWSAKDTVYTDVNTIYAGTTGVVAASYLGGFGDLSVAMLTDGTLKFTGSNSSGNVFDGRVQGGQRIINGWDGGAYPSTNSVLGFCLPTSLPLDDEDGPTNVTATKAQFNDHVDVTWTSKGAGYTYSVKRTVLGVSTIVASNITGTSYIDLSIDGGENKNVPVSYSVSVGKPSDIYEFKDGAKFIDPSQKFSGCDASSTLGSACVGFRANAPTNASQNTVNLVTGVSLQVIPTSGIVMEDIDSPYDTFTFTLNDLNANNGTLTTNAGGQFLYTPNAGYIGLDQIFVMVKDKADNGIEIPLNLNVQCPIPTMGTLTFPAVYGGFTTQVGTIQYSANACNGSMAADVEIMVKGSSTVISSYTNNFTAMTTGVNQSKQFTMLNVPSGDYTMRVKLRSEVTGMITTNFAEKTLDFKVNPVGTYSLAVPNISYTEDELIPVNVVSGAGSCPIVSYSNARATGGCYVLWQTHPFYQTLNANDVNISGYGVPGMLQPITADIKKFDSSFNEHVVASLTSDINITAGVPTSLKPITVPTSIVRQLDSVRLVFERESGYACTFFTTTATAEAAALIGGKACLLEATLPQGLAWQTGGGATIVGRMTGAAGAYSIPYTLSKFYVGRTPSVITTGSLSLNVISPTLTLDVVKNKPAFVVNGTVATVEAKVTPLVAGGKTCSLTTSEAVAATSYNASAGLTCHVSWNTIPAGLVPDTSAGTLPKLKGIPTVLGENDLKYTVYAVKNLVGGGTSSDSLGVFEGKLTVTDMTPMDFTLSTPKEGKIQLSGESVQKVLVGDTGDIGEVQIISGDFSTVKMIIQEAGYAPQVFTGLKNGDKRNVAVSAGAKGAWINRTVTLKFEYEEVAVATQISRTLDLVQLPAQKMDIQIAVPTASPNDTAPFTFKAKMGVMASTFAYNASTGGIWKAALYVKQGLTMVPITNESTVDSFGNVTWDNLLYEDFVGIEFFAKASWVKPVDSTLSIADKEIVSVKGVTLVFVKGGALEAETMLGRLKGVVPMVQTFDLRLSAENTLALKNVVWLVSTDNVTFAPLGVAGRKATYTFNNGGVFYIKGEMTNKNTDIVSYSDSVMFTTSQIYKVAFGGDDLVMPGTVLPATLSVKNTDDTPANPSSLSIIWTVKNSQGFNETYTDVTSVNLESDVPTKFDVTARVKGKAMDADNPDSWYEIKKTYTFFTPTSPRITIGGPRVIEVGTNGLYTVTVRAPWLPATKTSLTMKGKWTLPDGVTEVPSLVDLDHLILEADGSLQTIKYTAWIDGMEAETSTSLTYKFSTTKYAFPTFKMSATVDSTFAPAYVKLAAIPATSADNIALRGKQITYTWTLAETDFVGKATGYAMRGIADKPGVYPFQVVITDSRGNTQTLDYSLTLESTVPWELTMNLVNGLKFNRNPMTFVAKMGSKGGHPRDRVKESTVSIDGVARPMINGFPKLIVVEEAGTHEVVLNVTSNMGATATVTSTVVVNANLKPVCTFTEAWDAARTIGKIAPKCTDSDGKIKKIVWFVDDVPYTRGGTNYYFYPTAEKPSVSIKAQVFDDSNEFSEYPFTLTK